MRTFFLVVSLVMLALNASFGALALGLLRRRKPWPRGLAIGLTAWMVLMLGLFALQLNAPVEWRPFMRRWLYFPMSVEMSWNLILVEALIPILIVVSLALRWFRPVRRDAPPLSGADLSRRKFIYLAACGAAPATALAMGVHGTSTRYDLRVRRFDLPIANLPPALEGFTIAHLSDLHSGIFCGVKRLEIIRSATNDLNADMVVITGDIINDHISEFPNALAAIRRLRAPHGLYLCEGNHDLIPGPGIFSAACAQSGLSLLSNATLPVAVGDARLLVAGVPWMGRHFRGDPQMVARLYPERGPKDVRLLLAHHPDFFDMADSADLVLSGHTHGGQIMLGPVGLGPMLFKYWSGRYVRGDTTLIVSNGCGDWFPCRIDAPAEIGLLRLTAKA